MRAEARVERLVAGRGEVLAEAHMAAAADAVAQRAQPVGGGRAVPREAAAVAAGCRLAVLVQRAVNVPSRCSSAFEVFCAGGSDALSVDAGDAAYGNVEPPPSGKT
jgi:hypothetical protein